MIVQNGSILRDGESLNDVIAARQAAAELHATTQRDLRYLPDTDDAAAELTSAEARVVSAEAAVKSTAERLRGAKEKAEKAQTALDVGRRALRDAETGLVYVAEAEAADYASGAETTAHDIAAAERAVAAARRRVEVLTKELGAASAPLDEASADASRARESLGSARLRAARAAAVQLAATAIPPLMERLAPLMKAYERAIGGCGPDLKASAAREHRRLLEQMTRELSQLLTEDAARTLPHAPPPPPRLAPPAAAEAATVTLRVRPGNTYGSARAGERVTVSEKEAAWQLRTSPVEGRSFGEPLGALETEQVYEARKFAAESERERPRHVLSPIVDAVERGLAELSARGEAKAAEKAAAEKAAQQEKLEATRAAVEAVRGGDRLRELVEKLVGRTGGGEL